MVDKKFAAQAALARTMLGLTVSAVSRMSGITGDTLKRIEQGDVWAGDTNAVSLQNTLENLGIEFSEDGESVTSFLLNLTDAVDGDEIGTVVYCAHLPMKCRRVRR